MNLFWNTVIVTVAIVFTLCVLAFAAGLLLGTISAVTDWMRERRGSPPPLPPQDDK